MEPLFPVEPGSAEGYVKCAFGHEHWGKNGAAGLLLAVPSPGGGDFLLQHRASEVHEGDCWALPGGALDWGEAPLEGALRETWEEMGVFPSKFVSALETAVDHGTWRYTTVLAVTAEKFTVEATSWETGAEGYAWVPYRELTQRRLHPGFYSYVRTVLRPLWPRLNRRHLAATSGRSRK